MTDEQVDPLVPADVDLRDFGYMPLDALRLRDSELAIEASPEVFRASVLLWCASWHQVPAGSLPDKDKTLCDYSRAGARWPRIRADVMSRWVKCSDGRLYHPVVAEKAREAQASKDSHRAKTKAATAAREAKRKAEQEAREREEQAKRDALDPAARDEGCDTIRDGLRDVERDDQRDVERDEVQEKGRERKGTEGKGTDLERRRGTRLPPDWHPGNTGLAFAQRMGLANGRAVAEIDRFRDHWAAKAGRDATKLDWQAAWREWIRKSIEFGALRRQPTPNDDPMAGAI